MKKFSRRVRSRKSRFGKRQARKFAAKRRNNRYKSNLSLGIGFPRKLTVTHKYNEIVQITSTTGIMQQYRFSANGLYDPNVTGTGHQPIFFDQMTPLYNHYTVIASKIKVTFVPQSGTSWAPVTVGLIINDDTASGYTDITTAAENSTGKSVMITALSARPTVLSQKWSAKKTFGGSILANTSLAGTSAANPTEQSYFDILVEALGTGTSAVYAKVELEMVAVWTEIKDIGTS